MAKKLQKITHDGSHLQTWWTSDAILEKERRRHRSSFDNRGSINQWLTNCAPKKYPLSFLERKDDIRSWRRSVIPELKNAMRIPSPSADRSPRLLRRIVEENCVHEELEFRSYLGFRIPASVFIPTNGRKKHPGIVLLHDMGGMRTYGREKLFSTPTEPNYLKIHRKKNYEGRSISRDLAREGFASIVIDAAMFGERTPLAEENLKEFLSIRQRWNQKQSREYSFSVAASERAAFYGCLLRNRTWAGIVAADDLATVDYFCDRPDIDETRIGCAGLSFGAYRTNYLMALDTRVRAGVSVCWASSLEGIIGYNVGGAMGAFTLIPGMHHRMDISDILSLTCPRALLVISGWKDQLMLPQGIVDSHRLLRKAWSRAGCPEKLGSLCFDSPHEFNRSMQKRAKEWLHLHLFN